MSRRNGHRKSILDLAPLELECLKALWPRGEATVREIRDAMAPVTPRAYTTVMTIMDRMAHKGLVTRRKKGRAYVYQPVLSADEARAQALGQVVKHYFGGSREALVAHLGGQGSSPSRERSLTSAPRPLSGRVREAEPHEPPLDTTLL